MGNSSSSKKKGKAKASPVLCEPTGLYDSCPWSTRAVGRLVVAKKLAPRYLGVEEEGGAECPICFLYYTEVNHVTCCNNDICTECYLQVKLPSGQSACPFCNSPALAALYSPPSSSSSSPSPTARSTPSSTPSRAQLSSPVHTTTPSTATTTSPASPVSSPSSSITSPPVVVSIAERYNLEQAMQSQRASDSSSVDHSQTSGWSRSRSRGRSNSAGDDGYGNGTHNGGGSRRRSGGHMGYGHSPLGARRQEQRRLSGRHRGGGSGSGSGRWEAPIGHYGEDTGEHDHEEQEMEEQEDSARRFNLEQVEEMMLLEAIRLSMLETETETQTQTAPLSSRENSVAAAVGLPPPPPLPSNSGQQSTAGLGGGAGVKLELREEEEEDECHPPKVSSTQEEIELSIHQNMLVTKQNSVKEDVLDEDKDCFEDEDEDEEEEHMLQLALTMSLGDGLPTTPPPPPLPATTTTTAGGGAGVQGFDTVVEGASLREQTDRECTSNLVSAAGTEDSSRLIYSGSPTKIAVTEAVQDALLKTGTGSAIDHSGSLSPAARKLVDKIDKALGESESDGHLGLQSTAEVDDTQESSDRSDSKTHSSDRDRDNDDNDNDSVSEVQINKVLFTDSCS